MRHNISGKIRGPIPYQPQFMKPETPDEGMPNYDPTMNYDPRMHQVGGYIILSYICQIYFPKVYRMCFLNKNIFFLLLTFYETK